MTQPDLVRPRYRENQQLSANDLDAEQAYLIATRRRHDVTAHAAGVAHGLTLCPLVTGCVITAGLAVDGLGRAVVLPDTVLLRWPDLPAGAAALDLFLSYREDVVADRVTEGADVHVTSVQPADTAAGPAHSVYLGRLVKSTGDGPPYTPAASQVVFVAAEGATVTAETGTTVRLGADPSVTIVVPDANGQPVPRLAVSPANGTSVNGTVVADDAQFAAGDHPLRFGAPVPVPQAAWPWRWYRAETMADGVVTGQQLRVELGAPANTGMPDWFRFAVKDGSGTFPLAVDAGGATTIGSLNVEGTLVLGPLAPDPNAPRLVAALVQTWTGAVDEGSRAVDKQFSGDLFDTSALTVTVTVVPPPSPQTATPPPPPPLTYTVTVTNGPGQPVTDLTIAAVNTINNDRSSERLVRLDTLLPRGTYTLTHNLPLPGPAGGVTVHVEVVALGLLSGGKVTLAITNFDWPGPTPPTAASRRTGRFPWR